MATTYEISEWDSHSGEFDEFMEVIESLKVAFMESDVTQAELLTGAAGIDVGQVVVIQPFEGVADIGALNETILDNEPMKKWRDEFPGVFFADLLSHDHYEEIDE